MNRVLPILFNTEMVRAILEGRKSCMRKICKDGNEYTVPDMNFYNADRRTYAVHNYADKKHADKLSIAERSCPICPGDILYVRETIWQKVGHYLDVDGETKGIFCHEYKYVATDERPETGWDYSWVKRPSIHMPKEAARIWLKVTDVKVERLQDITPKGAESEGVGNLFYDDIGYGEKNYGTEVDTEYGIAKEQFAWLWESTIKKSDLDRYGWDANPWVWVIEFERCEKPEA